MNTNLRLELKNTESIILESNTVHATIQTKHSALTTTPLTLM